MDAEVKRIVKEMLDDPTAEVQMFAGMAETTKPGETDASFAPTGGKTVVLSIKGGANNVRVERVKIEGEEDDEEDGA